jgi:hypothetical protein
MGSMMTRLLALTCCALLVASCAATPAADGNDKGGAIEGFGTTTQAKAAADKHCRRYGKSARITQTRSTAGGYVLFECI